jgi:aspartyl-tRNA(Asn)/glutamyl-tRNA(Gln) amidotransferase subunit B
VRRARYVDELGLSPYDADVLVTDAAASAIFESAREADPGISTKKLANWVSGEYLRLAKSEDAAVDVARVDGPQLAALVRLVEDGHISGTNAKQVLLRLAQSGRPVADIVAEAGYRQISDSGALQAAVDEVIAENPDAVADVRAGTQKAIGFLTGQVMKKTRGQANAGVVKDLLRSTLEVE